MTTWAILHEDGSIDPLDREDRLLWNALDIVRAFRAVGMPVRFVRLPVAQRDEIQ